MTKDKDGVTLTNISHPRSIAYSEEEWAQIQKQEEADDRLQRLRKAMIAAGFPDPDLFDVSAEINGETIDLAPTKADAMVALWGSQTKCKVCGASFMPQNDGSKWHLATWDCSLVTGIDKP